MSAPQPFERARQLVLAMAYEVWVVLISGALLSILGFAAMGGSFGDLYLKLRGTAETSGKVAQVTIGEEALYLFDPERRSPEVTPRAMLAQIVAFLDAAGAEVVVLDILLDQPAPGDDALAAAAQAHGAVVAAEKAVLTEPATGRQFQPGLSAPFAGMHSGFANLVEEDSLLSDGLLVRGMNLVHRADRAQVAGQWPSNLVGASQEDDAISASLPLTAAWLFTRRQRGESGAVDALDRALAAQCSGTPLRCSGDLDPLGLPARGAPLHEPLRINYRASERNDPLPTVRAATILRVMGQVALMRQMGAEVPLEVPAELREALQGKVVVVGRADQVGSEAADRFITPYSFPFFLGEDMAGCRIQAQTIDTLLSGRHLREVGGWPMGLIALLAVVLAVRSRRVVDEPLYTATWLFTSVGLVGLGIAVFRVSDGVVLHLGPVVTGIMLALLVRQLWDWAGEEVAENTADVRES